MSGGLGHPSNIVEFVYLKKEFIRIAIGAFIEGHAYMGKDVTTESFPFKHLEI
jgi:hypothetical protein